MVVTIQVVPHNFSRTKRYRGCPAPNRTCRKSNAAPFTNTRGWPHAYPASWIMTYISLQMVVGGHIHRSRYVKRARGESISDFHPPLRVRRQNRSNLNRFLETAVAHLSILIPHGLSLRARNGLICCSISHRNPGFVPQSAQIRKSPRAWLAHSDPTESLSRSILPARFWAVIFASYSLLSTLDRVPRILQGHSSLSILYDTCQTRRLQTKFFLWVRATPRFTRSPWAGWTYLRTKIYSTSRFQIPTDA